MGLPGRLQKLRLQGGLQGVRSVQREVEAEEGVMQVDCGFAKPDPPEKVAKELRNVLSTLTGLKGGNSQGHLMVADVQVRLRAAEDEIRQGKPALVRLQTATRQKEALAVSMARPEPTRRPERSSRSRKPH